MQNSEHSGVKKILIVVLVIHINAHLLVYNKKHFPVPLFYVEINLCCFLTGSSGKTKNPVL